MSIDMVDYLFDLAILTGLFVVYMGIGFYAVKVLMEVWDWWTWRS